MATLFARHDVVDFARWKLAYDAFDEERRSMGVVDQGVFQADGNPNNVTVYHDFETMEAAKSFASSKRLGEVMQAAGVQGQPDVWIVTQA